MLTFGNLARLGMVVLLLALQSVMGAPVARPAFAQQAAGLADDDLDDPFLEAASVSRTSTTALASTPGSVALGAYRPSFPNDLSGLSQYEKAMKHPVSIVHWYALWGGWKSAFSRADLDAVSTHGSLPMITWEPWSGNGPDPAWSLSNAILSGQNDAYITTWAQGMAAYGKPVVLRFAHEMHNQPSYPWAVGINGNTAADYVAAWKRVRGIFRAAGATNVLWVWNPNTLGTAPVSAYQSTYAALYPGDDQVDYLGLDIYNTGPQLDWGAPFWRSFGDALANPYAAITGVSAKRLLLPEVGSTETGGSKAQWIQDALGSGLDRFPAVRALVWFDVDKEQPWSLHSSTTALSAWTTASAAPRFNVGPSLPA
jgi:hypothetical protein